ncbi:MAG TPA: cytochrome P450 [Candidatus Nanopelagicales bacterium]|nr:cytochrome P450 [Candidatus Nanopelagicales bacterium]
MSQPETDQQIPEILYNPMAPGFDEDPFPTYAQMREAPVYFWPMAGFYIVARFNDVIALLRDPRLTTDPVAAGHPAPEAMLPDAIRKPIESSLTRLSPKDHARVRRAVSPAFTPRAIERLRPEIQRVVDEALAQFVVDGELDAVKFVEYIPLRVIATMLGIPAEHDETFRKFGHALVKLHDPRMTPDAFAEVAPPVLMGIDLIRGLIAERRNNLGEDLLSTVIRAEETGDGLSEDEMVGLVAMLINGGSLTTLHFLSFAVKSLCCVPERAAEVRAEPAILPSALEEVLRHDSFGKSGTLRFATEDIEVSGVRLPRGARILVFFPAAYRDPSAFPDADRFDPRRKPTENLNYGHGMHFCTGAALARLEGEVAIGTLFDRYADMRLAADVVFAMHPLVREIASMRVKVTPKTM